MRALSSITAVLLMVAAGGPAIAGPPATTPTTRPADGVEFLAGDAARDAIVDDHLDPYFDQLTATEMAMKVARPVAGDTPAAQHADCRARYRAAVREFTDEDKRAMTAFVAAVRPALVRDYPAFGRQPFSFIKVADSLEGGMPHTRGSHVVMPAGLLKAFDQIEAHGASAMETAGIVNLIVHEQTHVVERLHPDLFEPLYTKTWGFVRAARIEPNAWLDARQLVNPDGTVCDWVLPMSEGENHDKHAVVLPLVAFDTDRPRSMRRDMQTIAVTVEPTGKPGEYRAVLGGDGNPVVRRLDWVGAYTAVAGRGGDNYHPNEIAADAFARLVVADEMKPNPADKPGKTDAALKPVRDWAKAAFAEKK